MKSKKKQKKVKKTSGKPQKKATKKQVSSKKKPSSSKKSAVKKTTKKASKKSTQKSVKKSVKKVVKKSVKKVSTKASVKKSSVKKESIKKQTSKKPKKGVGAQKTGTSYLSFLEDELKSITERSGQVAIKSPEGFTYCCEEDCDQVETTDGYCRYHYLMNWQQIKVKSVILSNNKIQEWVEQLVQAHSPKLLDYMIRDLSNEKDFSVALSDMKIQPESSD